MTIRQGCADPRRMILEFELQMPIIMLNNLNAHEMRVAVARDGLFWRLETFERVVVEQNDDASDFLLRTHSRDGLHYRCRNAALVRVARRFEIICRGAMLSVRFGSRFARLGKEISGRLNARRDGVLRDLAVHRFLVEEQPVGIYLREPP